MKRLVLHFLIIATAWQCTGPEKPSIATALIPSDAAVVLRVNDGRFLRDGLQLDESWMILDSVMRTAWTQRQLNDLVQQLDSGNKGFKGYLSWHAAGASKYDFLLTTSGSMLGLKGWTLSKTYEDVQIFESKDLEDWYLAQFNGVIVASQSLLLMERSILQTSRNKGLASTPGFTALEKISASSDPANLFIQWDEATSLLQHYHGSGLLAHHPFAGSWTELDISLGDHLLFTGITELTDSIPHALDVFANNAPRMSNFEDYLPNNTSFFTALHFENFETYRREYYQYLKQMHLETLYEKLQSTPVIMDGLSGWIDQSMVLFYTDLPRGDYQDRANALIRMRDHLLTEELLKPLRVAETYEDIAGFEVYKLNVNAMSTALGSVFYDVSEPYFTFLDDWVLFSEDLADMRSIINAIRSKRTLAESEGYSSHRKALQERSHVLIYADIARASEAFAPLWKQGFPSWMQSWGKMFMQVEATSNLAHTHLLFTAPSSGENEVTSYFTTALDTAIQWGPQPFKSHLTNEREVLVQDARYQLYLISSEGTILWKKPLDGPIMGEVFQVDAYQNNKLQFAFNTPKSVYFVDRNGVDIGAFPLQITNGICAPIAVLDYDQNRNYRILVPTENRIDNYTFDGAILGGWNAQFSGETVTQQPQLFQVGGKDYIFIQTDKKRVLALNRRGEVRLSYKANPQLASGPFYLFRGWNESLVRVVKATNSNLLNHYFFDEIQDELPVDRLDSGSVFAVIQDHFGSFTDGTLAIQGPEYRWDKEFESGQFLKGYRFESGTHWGITDTTKKEVWVLAPEGEAVEGFPVRGDLEGFIAPLNGDGTMFLITGEAEGYVHVYATPL